MPKPITHTEATAAATAINNHIVVAEAWHLSTCLDALVTRIKQLEARVQQLQSEQDG